MERINLRLWFTKLGLTKYISHLDVTRLMQRALTRADVPIWYTQGFNPHPYMTFALPLSLGCESNCESMDFKMEENLFTSEKDIMERLNAVLPEGIKVISISEQIKDPKVIKYADYIIKISDDEKSAEQVKSALDVMLAEEKIIVMKKSKSGIKEFDLKPHLISFKCDIKDGEVVINLRLPAGNVLNVNANLFSDKLSEMLDKKLDYVNITRIAVLDENGEDFK